MCVCVVGGVHPLQQLRGMRAVDKSVFSQVCCPPEFQKAPPDNSSHRAICSNLKIVVLEEGVPFPVCRKACLEPTAVLLVHSLVQMYYSENDPEGEGPELGNGIANDF